MPADIGFAVGIVGIQIAKDSADTICIVDNFATIVTAAKWELMCTRRSKSSCSFSCQCQRSRDSVGRSFCVSDQPSRCYTTLLVHLLMYPLASLALDQSPQSVITAETAGESNRQHDYKTYAGQHARSSDQHLRNSP